MLATIATVWPLAAQLDAKDICKTQMKLSTPPERICIIRVVNLDICHMHNHVHVVSEWTQ